MSRPSGTRIPCPECRSVKSEVRDTIAWQESIRRRRRCERGHLWWTVEVSEKPLKAL